MRRVQSIALVHETLSVSIDETVDFDEVVDRLLRDAQRRDGLGATGSRCAGPAASATLPAEIGDGARPGAHRAGAERDRARVPGRSRTAR